MVTVMVPLNDRDAEALRQSAKELENADLAAMLLDILRRRELRLDPKGVTRP